MEPKRSARDGFAQMLRAEWATFYAVRGFLIAMLLATLATMLLGLVALRQNTCEGSSNGNVCPSIPVGPGGQAVTDRFYFVHRSLVGDGNITVRITSLTGIITYPPPNHDQIVPGVVPWTKAGIIIKESTNQGSAYAAMMITGNHGVRMQYNFTEDIAGSPGGVSTESPRWLRLTRSGDTLTGYESADGVRWSQVGEVHLDKLSSTVQIGLFAASPCDLTVEEGKCRFTQATAVFDHVSLQGNVSQGIWNRDDIGVSREADGTSHHPGGLKISGETFTVTGSGDIAPLLGAGAGSPIENSLIGAVVAMMVVSVVAVLFARARQQDGHLHTKEYISPKSGWVLAVKAIVIGLVTFTTQLVAVVVAVQLGKLLLLSKGSFFLPAGTLTELRVIFGTAAIVSVTAILALALGALFRRRIVAVAASIALMPLPFILVFANLVPEAVSQWLLRLTPAAGFAIQQSIPEYPQVIGLYTVQIGYYPLAPWAGFAVLCAYTALALGLAFFVPRRRDA